MASSMLERLKTKSSHRADQIHLIEANYLDAPFGEDEFDCAISTAKWGMDLYYDTDLATEALL